VRSSKVATRVLVRKCADQAYLLRGENGPLVTLVLPTRRRGVQRDSRTQESPGCRRAGQR
jgi:hypothetical protein